MEVARGTLGDRPWGATLATLERRRHTGILTLLATDSGPSSAPFVIELLEGAVVAAHSPVAADGAARIAAAIELVGDPAGLAARIAATAGAGARDEIAVIAELEKLTAAQAAELRSAILVRRVARTFACNGGSFGITNDAPRSTDGAGIAIPHAIFQGVLTRMSDKRLAEDISMFPARFALEDEIDGNTYGFGNGELQPPLLAMRANSSLAELEVRFVALGIRRVQAAVYTLLACGACVPIDAPLVPHAPERARANTLRVTVRQSTAPPFADSTPVPMVSRTTSGERTPASGTLPPRTVTPPSLARTLSRSEPDAQRTSSPDLARPARTPTAPPIARAPMPTPTATPTSTSTPTPASDSEVDFPNDFEPELAAGSQPRVSRTASPDRTPTSSRDRTPTSRDRTPTSPDRTPTRPSQPAIGRAPSPEHARLRPPSQPSVARTISPDLARDPSRVPRTLTPGALLSRTLTPRPGGTMPPPEITTAAAIAAYDSGMRALSEGVHTEAITQLSRAVALAAGKVEYAAALAWAKFCAAPDKAEAAPEARRMLGVLVPRETVPKLARYYLGRVERLVGREREALIHFREVLSTQPSHAEAIAEINAIEAEIQRRSPRR